MVELPKEFRTQLASYRGPLDLLLYLIKKEELDVLDIPVSLITEQYLLYLHVLKTVDPNVCSEFLVMAAQLMEIKSKSLLPIEVEDEDGEGEDDDPRLELVLQLLEYKKYKDRALLLERKVAEQNQRYRRPYQKLSGLLDDADEGSFSVGDVSIWDLLTAFQKVQIALKQRQPHRVLFEDRPIEEYMQAIQDRLGARIDGEVFFEQLFEDCDSRYDMVGYLLAILEMAKQSLIRFEQEEMFGPIRIVLKALLSDVHAREAHVTDRVATDPLVADAAVRGAEAAQPDDGGEERENS